MGNFWPLNLKTWDEMDIFLEKYNIPGSTKEKDNKGTGSVVRNSPTIKDYKIFKEQLISSHIYYPENKEQHSTTKKM